MKTFLTFPVAGLKKWQLADIFAPLVFLYFCTIHADQLSLRLATHTIRLNNLLALGMLLLMVLRYHKQLWQIDRWIVVALLFIIFSLCISFLFSPYKLRCCVFLGWFGFTFFCYFLLPYQLVCCWGAKRVGLFYFASFIVVGLFAFLQLLLSFCHLPTPFVSQYISSHICRPNAFCYEPSYYALYMTPFVMMVNVYYLAKRAPLSLVLFANFLYFLSTSTSTVFAYLVFFLVIPFFYRERLLRFFLGFLAIGTVCALPMMRVAKSYFLKFFYQGIKHGSFVIRWEGIVDCWRLFLQRPWIGVGFGGVSPQRYYSWLATHEHKEYMDEVTSSIGWIKYFEPTNIALEVLASLGVVGMVVMGFFVVSYFRKSYKL
ncbi:MAG: O-antigen ligase family protein, partial [Chlamydiales bacterium]